MTVVGWRSDGPARARGQPRDPGPARGRGSNRERAAARRDMQPAGPPERPSRGRNGCTSEGRGARLLMDGSAAARLETVVSLVFVRSTRRLGGQRRPIPTRRLRRSRETVTLFPSGGPAGACASCPSRHENDAPAGPPMAGRRFRMSCWGRAEGPPTSLPYARSRLCALRA